MHNLTVFTLPTDGLAPLYSDYQVRLPIVVRDRLFEGWRGGATWSFKLQKC